MLQNILNDGKEFNHIHSVAYFQNKDWTAYEIWKMKSQVQMFKV